MDKVDTGMVFAAKTNKEGMWESLARHHDDTAGTIALLGDPDKGWVSPAFIRASGLAPSLFKKVCIYIAAVHDIGKQTPIFQHRIGRQLPGLEERLLEYGFDTGPGKTDSPCFHAFLSGAILHEKFGVNESICEVAASHHGAPRKKSREFKWSRPFRIHKEMVEGKDGEYEKAWKDTVLHAESLSGLSSDELPALTLAGQILLSHMVIAADWISSNEEFFPLVSPWRDTGLPGMERAAAGYEKSGVKRGWFPQTYACSDEVFEGRFGFPPNRMQESAFTAAGDGARMIIIEAPMGTGKTEAALMCAEVMASLRESGGLYIGLPTRATANGLFPRMLSWAGKVSWGLPVTVNLSHSSSMYNDDYRALLVNNGEEDTGGMSINQWMSKRHRKLMADFVDGTIDQAISMALNRKFFMLLHGQLAGKAVVFDEVHSYDAYTDAYITTALSYLGLYKCPVILLSATLTDEKKKEFLQAYMKGYGKDAEVPVTGGYPVVTWYDGEKVRVSVIPAKESGKRYEVRWTEGNALAEAVRAELSGGGCAGIIRNTVKEAIQTYRFLKEEMPDHRIILIHSRFLAEDRARLEKAVIRLAGKASTERDRDGLIVIGTQVLEQSLDLDFDVLFTDLCPMDLLLQRLGREHRHKRPRPDGLEAPKLHILLKEGSPVGGGGRPYDDYVMGRTIEILRKKDVIVLPKDIKALVEDTYDMTKTGESTAKTRYADALDTLSVKSKAARIPEPQDASSIRDFCQGGDETEAFGVRETTGSWEVLLLKKKGGLIMDLSERVSCPAGTCPDDKVGAVFLRQSISVPSYMISREDLERMKAAAGLKEYPLWTYRDMILVDEDNDYECTGDGRTQTYHYSPETGLWRKERECR